MHEPTDNPYATPYVAESVEAVSAAPDWGLQSVARRVFLDWEKLRLFYNATLIAVCLLCAFLTQAFQLAEFWIACVVAGIGANVCFFIGPLFETYATWLKKRELKSMRKGLFLLGLLFSTVLAILGTAAAGFGLMQAQ